MVKQLHKNDTCDYDSLSLAEEGGKIIFLYFDKLMQNMSIIRKSGEPGA